MEDTPEAEDAIAQSSIPGTPESEAALQAALEVQEEDLDPMEEAALE